ncbi:hypothetical protein HZC30_04340 [Candidatus Woesearchaeota archaeon]|nr:hypothetical protein [Candidatus Woesearchaeota archaeon]
MGIDQKTGITNEETLRIAVYLTSAPSATYQTRKRLQVEYDTRLEDTLIAQGVERKAAEETALLFASGAENVTVILKDGGFWQYKKIEDHAHMGVDVQDSEDRIHRKARVRDLVYRVIMRTDKGMKSMDRSA